ncbi:Nuclear transport factor 2 (NTF2) domain containing protein, putative [Leishmania lindenbergi]|uniref:Nuclear transport factor 2 (NTF2) domain containing protein n=1 Tax=Leishmania lindenbergi TaxID=651832 RepID=A0AAW3AMF6_9TRYP
MTVDMPDTRLQSIGVSFAVHYYTTLVETPEALAALYVPSANVVHSFRKSNGAVELSSLLTSLTAEGVTRVRVEDVMSELAASGAIKITVKGQLIGTARTQSFTQEVKLYKLAKNTYGITDDKLSYSAAGQTALAAETPLLKEAEESTVGTAVVVAEEETPAELAAVHAPATRKKPASFAEALRLSKVSEGAAFSNTAVRVSDKVKATRKIAKVKAEEKDVLQSAGSAKPKLTKKLPRASNSVVYYDIILKELPESITEEKVRAVVTPVSAVKLVNLVKSERRRRSKEATSEVITCAFVELERPANAAANHVKEVVAKLTEMNKGMRIEEVREKSALAGSRKPREGSVATLKEEGKA